eukprot:46469-Eustigmatos_ZCMA.PRE.1
MAAGATHLISMAFTVALSTWLFAFVDWHGLTTCSDETSCHTLSHYIHWEVRRCRVLLLHMSAARVGGD